MILGHTEDSREFSLAVRGRNVLIMGETNSGKSWLAGLLCERLIPHGYGLCVIDRRATIEPSMRCRASACWEETMIRPRHARCSTRSGIPIEAW